MATWNLVNIGSGLMAGCGWRHQPSQSEPMLTWDHKSSLPGFISLTHSGTHWPLKDVQKSKKIYFSNEHLSLWIYWCTNKMSIYWRLRFLSQHWFRLSVMARCRQATSQNLRQWWPKSVLPYGVTKPQWVNSQCLLFVKNICEILLEKIALVIFNFQDFFKPSQGPMS